MDRTSKRKLPEMTRIPLPDPHLPSLSPPAAAAAAARIRTMASSSAFASASTSASETLTGLYPKPVSPPYPELSKEVELRRAMLAESRSATYEIDSRDVLYEDTWLSVVNKPAGIYCETLLSALASRPGTETVQSDLHLANRLDRDTSGLMIITKSNKAASRFVKAFTNHNVKKTYLALCIGRSPKWEKIAISSGHGRSKFGAWRVYASSDIGRSLPGGSMVRDMTTSFEVLSINGKGKYREPIELDTNELESIVVEEKGDDEDNDENVDEILVRAYPKSGRTHQIRLHCQHLGISIRGDVKYGGVDEWRGSKCDGHALHAESLSFIHPITNEHVRFRAPAPLWLDELHGAMSRVQGQSAR